MLGDRVREAAGHDLERVRGGDVDDGAAAIDHVRQHFSAEPPNGLQVDAQAALPGVLGQFKGVIGHEDAGVVDEDVWRTVVLECAGDERSELLAISHVGGDGQC